MKLSNLPQVTQPLESSFKIISDTDETIRGSRPILQSKIPWPVGCHGAHL